ncbi:MAG: hypothetical protein ISS82_04000, partial [Nanoarchaeota archaeon]|nr:hypothetical protein [Nanoarchaeota archaeon]
MVKKKKVLDILVWIAFAIVVIYIFLKMLGIIKSPITIDIIALLSGAYFVGRYAKRIDDTFNDSKNVKRDIRELNRKCPIFKERGT